MLNDIAMRRAASIATMRRSFHAMASAGAATEVIGRKWPEASSPTHPEAAIGTFRWMRESGTTYVDKTAIVDELIATDHNYVLCRPPRFGKSVLITMLKELFQGNKIYFDGTVGPRLDIANMGWKWGRETHTVLHFDMRALSAVPVSFRAHLIASMCSKAADLGTVLTDTDSLKSATRDLIGAAAAKSPSGACVILVDNYDSPLRVQEQPIMRTGGALMSDNALVLSDWLTAVKAEATKIRFQLHVGAYKVATSTIDSRVDVSLSNLFSPICGFTSAEIAASYPAQLDFLQAHLNCKHRSELMHSIEEWYGGYAWGEAHERVHCPFSVTCLLTNHEFRGYWSEQTAIPLWIQSALRSSDMSDLCTSIFFLPEVFDTIGKISPETTKRNRLVDILRFSLLQLGLLTIKQVDYSPMTLQRVVRLGVPNKDVAQIMQSFPAVPEASDMLHPW